MRTSSAIDPSRGFGADYLDHADSKSQAAHKLAVISYSLLTHGTTYIDIGEQAYEQKYKERRLKAMQKQALALGYQLVPAT